MFTSNVRVSQLLRESFADTVSAGQVYEQGRGSGADQGAYSTNAGVAVFLQYGEDFCHYVDPGLAAQNMFVSGAPKERPPRTTSALILGAVGAKVDRVIVTDLKSGTYFGRLIITAENELQQRKIIELDSRPATAWPWRLQKPQSSLAGKSGTKSKTCPTC